MTRRLIPSMSPEHQRTVVSPSAARWPLVIVLTLGFLLSTSSATQAADLSVENVPVFSGSKLKIGSSVTINGKPVRKGIAGPASVIQRDGFRAKRKNPWPALKPATFPPNASTTDATDAHAPFVSVKEVFYREISLAPGAEARFEGGGPFHIHELILQDEGTVRLGAGTYFVNKLKLYGQRAQLLVTSEPVMLHIGKKFVAGNDDIVVNPGGTVTGLRVFLHTDAELKGGEGLQFTGLVYGPNNKRVKLRDGVTFRGTIRTLGEIRVEKDVVLTYTASDQASVKAMDLGRSVR